MKRRYSYFLCALGVAVFFSMQACAEEVSRNIDDPLNPEYVKWQSAAQALSGGMIREILKNYEDVFQAQAVLRLCGKVGLADRLSEYENTVILVMPEEVLSKKISAAHLGQDDEARLKTNARKYLQMGALGYKDGQRVAYTRVFKAAEELHDTELKKNICAESVMAALQFIKKNSARKKAYEAEQERMKAEQERMKAEYIKKGEGMMKPEIKKPEESPK